MPTFLREKTTPLRGENHPFGGIQPPLLGNKTTPQNHPGWFYKTTPGGFMPTFLREKTTPCGRENHPFGGIQPPLLGNKTTPLIKTTPGWFYATKTTNETTQQKKAV